MPNLTPDIAARLLIRYFNQELLTDEEELLEEWLKQSQDNRDLLRLLSDKTYLQQQTTVYNSIDEQGSWQRIQTLISSAGPGSEITAVSPLKRIPLWKRSWTRYAAILVICAGIGIYMLHERSNPVTQAVQEQVKEAGIGPGSAFAYLTLADGSTILLDSTANGRIATQGNTAITKLQNGQLVYDVQKPSGEVSMNTMSTPGGAQFTLSLPDGSRVWLNAASSITFPASFEGRERRVKLTGEAYLEVNHSSHQPFIIDIGNTSVQVLGTSFNINSYPDEDNIKTTLLEGSLKVQQRAGNDKESAVLDQVVLKPGQEASTRNHYQKIQVSNKSNAVQSIAWKNGLFNFSGSGLRSAMRQLERWYNIKVEYSQPVSNIILDGEMYRNLPLNDVLDALKGMGMKYRLEGRTLTIFN